MSQGSEWVFEVVLPLPFGWSLIRLKPKFLSVAGKNFKRHWLFHRKVQLGVGTYREQYWPKDYYAIQE